MCNEMMTSDACRDHNGKISIHRFSWAGRESRGRSDPSADRGTPADSLPNWPATNAGTEPPLPANIEKKQRRDVATRTTHSSSTTPTSLSISDAALRGSTENAFRPASEIDKKKALSSVLFPRTTNSIKSENRWCSWNDLDALKWNNCNLIRPRNRRKN